MKQKIMIAVCALLLTPSAAMAQYPQLSGEGAARIDSMKKAWERHADEAWTKAFPIVQKEAQQGPFIGMAALRTNTLITEEASYRHERFFNESKDLFHERCFQ